MILEIIILTCIVVILTILFRKLPNVISFKNLFKSKPLQLNNNESMKTGLKQNFSFFPKSEDTQKLFTISDQLFNEEKFSEAEKIYLKIAASNPKNIKVYNRLGVIYLEQKNHKDAQAAFLQAIKLDPKKASRHFNYAIASIELKEYRNAIEALEKAVKLDKKSQKYKDLVCEVKKKIKTKPEEPEE